jgi:hypothetical protein
MLDWYSHGRDAVRAKMPSLQTSNRRCIQHVVTCSFENFNGRNRTVWLDVNFEKPHCLPSAAFSLAMGIRSAAHKGPARVLRAYSAARHARKYCWVYPGRRAAPNSIEKARQPGTLPSSNENKISHRWRGRAWQRDVRSESWKSWSYAGQRLAASHG